MAMNTDAWGIYDRYLDARRRWRATSDATRAGILAAMRTEEEENEVGSETQPTVRVVRVGQSAPCEPGELRLEDGTSLAVVDRLPPDLPAGYHDFRAAGSEVSVRLIATPGKCRLPAVSRQWGWAAQLYAARSSQSWGIGDLADLRRLARWSADLDAGVLLVNPLAAPAPVLPQEASPYFPSSRLFRNPLYLCVEEAHGFSTADAKLAELSAAGRRLNGQPLIERDPIYRLKVQALERLWRQFPGDAAFDRYCREQGAILERFGTFCALAERFGKCWRQWESVYRRPDAPGVARFAAAESDRVRFHQWLQWLADEQLARASAEVAVVQDLPIGVDPDGADAWAWQDLLAHGATVGAPPDLYNTQGQDWGLPPFVPHRLRAAGYEPFIRTIRSALAHAGGLRIDHILGYFRLFWIPAGFAPAQGGYVRYPAEEFLAILAIESQRAGAFIVGEDLGTVEKGTREQLADHDILSYRLLYFEKTPPAEYTQKALAAIDTHDLPTIAGLWTGSDLADQRETGLEPNEQTVLKLRAHVAKMAGLASDETLETVIVRAHRALAKSPSMIVTATLDDALAVTKRPNMPSSGDKWPNWSLPLPASLEDLEDTSLARSIAAALMRPE